MASFTVDRVDFVGDRSLKRGMSYQIPITIKSQGIPIDLSSFGAKCQIKQFYDSPVAVYEPTISIMSPANGLVHLIVDGRDTLNIKPRIYRYDINFFNVNNDYYTFIEGNIEFSWAVTRI